MLITKSVNRSSRYGARRWAPALRGLFEQSQVQETNVLCDIAHDRVGACHSLALLCGHGGVIRGSGTGAFVRVPRRTEGNLLGIASPDEVPNRTTTPIDGTHAQR